MKFRARKRVRLGIFYINFTQRMNPFVGLLLMAFGKKERLFSSWGIQIGPWTRNFTTGKETFNTPGPGSLHFGEGKKRRKR